ncbi:MAG: hypothetical protein E7345_01735 [Clostridiales bacterium]|nr:hypothetical protein [Clostridiales bacterium]
MNSVSSKWSWKGIMNFLSFIATVSIAVSLVLSKIGSISTVFRTIAEVIAYSLTTISAFFYVAYKRKLVYYIIWIICVVIIVLLLILR